jgi:hypothetical protein
MLVADLARDLKVRSLLVQNDDDEDCGNTTTSPSFLLLSCYLFFTHEDRHFVFGFLFFAYFLLLHTSIHTYHRTRPHGSKRSGCWRTMRSWPKWKL